MPYLPQTERYQHMSYRRCGESGIKLPAISLGLWHNFGFVDNLETCRDIIRTAFDNGITHFDLANNYGPPYGSAEENFGRILDLDMRPFRDELIISSKAGYDMWPGPYGNWGSKKYLTASLDQSLRRMKLDYVDIFYHHRPDPETPLEETMRALDLIVRQGKALYAGISNYPAELARRAFELLQSYGTPCLIHQPRYSMLDRQAEDGLLDVLEEHGVGCIPFSPLAQGMLTDKYLNGIPQGSRADKAHGHLQREQITPERLRTINALNNLAQKRGQTLAQMAIAWLLKDSRVTSVLLGASSRQQLLENIAALSKQNFTIDELMQIDQILVEE